MSKIEILYEDDDIRVRGEVFDVHFYLHIDVYKYSPSIKRKILQIKEVIGEEVFLAGWDRIFSYNTNVKFAKLFGFKKVQTVEVGNFKTELYVWELD